MLNSGKKNCALRDKKDKIEFTKKREKISESNT